MYALTVQQIQEGRDAWFAIQGRIWAWLNENVRPKSCRSIPATDSPFAGLDLRTLYRAWRDFSDAYKKSRPVEWPYFAGCPARNGSILYNERPDRDNDFLYQVESEVKCLTNRYEVTPELWRAYSSDARRHVKGVRKWFRDLESTMKDRRKAGQKTGRKRGRPIDAAGRKKLLEEYQTGWDDGKWKSPTRFAHETHREPRTMRRQIKQAEAEAMKRGQ